MVGLAALLLALVVFMPALKGGFVNWDDDSLLVHNPHFRGLDWSHLRWMFTTFHMGHYQPLSWLTLAVDWHLWGLDPRGYHLTNVLLHAVNTFLVFLLACRLLAYAGGVAASDASSPKAGAGRAGVRLPAAAGLAALLFAVHPLRVESVAWVTQRRDVLSALFFLAAVLAYLRAVGPSGFPGRRRRLLLPVAVLLALLSTLSKTIGVVLPAIVLLLDVYPLRRLPAADGWLGRDARGVYLEKLPFLAIAAAGSALAIAAQRAAGAMAEPWVLGLGQRLVIATRGLAFYVWKTLVPLRLAPLYEIPYGGVPIDASFGASLATVAAVTVAAVVLVHRHPGLLAGWLAYAVLILPVSGLFQSGPQLAADRYSYLACVPFAVLAAGLLLNAGQPRAAGGLAGAGRWPVVSAVAGGAVGACFITVLSVLTVRQIGIWRDSRTLWEATLARYPSTSIAYLNRAALWLADNDLERAETDLRRAIKLYPNYAEALATLAAVRAQHQDYLEAEELARRAVLADPRMSLAYKEHGYALFRLGRVGEAIAAYRRAVALAPQDWESQSRLASLLQMDGRLGEALVHAEAAVDLAPAESAGPCYELLALLYHEAGQIDRAISAARRLVELEPHNAAARQLLGQLERDAERPLP